MVDLTVLADEPYPAAVLIVGGLLSIFIAIYGRRDDSYVDELGTIIAFILGAGMLVMAYFVATEGTTGWFTLAVMITLALMLFLKPLRQLRWSALIGLAVGAIVAFLLSQVLPSTVFGVDEWVILLMVFFIVGGIIHAIFHFFEDVLAIATMVLSWKPVMVLIGLAAIAEGALVLMDSSIGSFM